LGEENKPVLSAIIRDIAIIVIAVQSIVIGILIAVLIWQIWRLVKVIETEVRPIIEDTQATVNTVRGTATFVSDTVVKPVIRTNRAVARWAGVARALRRDLRGLVPRRKGAKPDNGSAA
jgi:hypothetical protein